MADNKLGGTVVAHRDWSAIEKCLHRLEEGDVCALLKLAKANNAVLEWTNLGHHYILGTPVLRRIPAKWTYSFRQMAT